MKSIAIILDPAHGSNVSGKCSPDKKHYEYRWSRERVKSLKDKLSAIGYEVYMTTESEKEPGLSKRKDFATKLKTNCKKLLISLHNNAAGSGLTWMTATGVEIYTTPGVTDSDKCADVIIQDLRKNFPSYKMRLNKDVFLQRDKEARYTVLMGSGYMAVLLEWLFQDNKGDVAKLLDKDINDKFEQSLIESIEKINEQFSK